MEREHTRKIKVMANSDLNVVSSLQQSAVTTDKNTIQINEIN